MVVKQIKLISSVSFLKGEKDMAVTRAWKIYGKDGHRQRESFGESYRLDFTEDNNIHVLEVLNSDITGTNEYSIFIITRNTAEECKSTLLSQIDDGAFENSRTGKEEEIPLSELEKFNRSAIITKYMHSSAKKKRYICVEKKTHKVLAAQVSYDTLSVRDFIFLVGRNPDELEVIAEEV